MIKPWNGYDRTRITLGTKPRSLLAFRDEAAELLGSAIKTTMRGKAVTGGQRANAECVIHRQAPSTRQTGRISLRA